MKLSHPSLSLHAIIISYHRVQHTPSTASSQDRQSPAPSQFLISQRMMYSILYIRTIPSEQWIQSQLLSCLPPELPPPDRPPPCTPPISLDHGLHVHISKLTPIQSPSGSPNSLEYGLHKCISKLARSLSRSASLCSLDHGLQVYLQIRSITVSKCLSKVARSRPPSVSLSSLNVSLQVHI